MIKMDENLSMFNSAITKYYDESLCEFESYIIHTSALSRDNTFNCSNRPYETENIEDKCPPPPQKKKKIKDFHFPFAWHRYMHDADNFEDALQFTVTV